MRKFKWLLLGAPAALAGVLFVVGVYAVRPSLITRESPERIPEKLRQKGPDRVTWESFDRIKTGMSKAEVEAILGPAGDFATEETVLVSNLSNPFDEVGSSMISPISGGVAMWQDDRAVIVVSASSAGNVCYASYYPAQRVDHGPLGNFLWRAKRQWRRWFPETP